MVLKSLELNGFKSFAQKTILEFPKGITAVVGPNGSGKSNVIDAIRWILGEREAKNLRGGKAEDLIFAGTPKKARVGMAQVAIRFDNTSRFFPVDFDEVSVTREVNRDGNSTYFLNKSEVRAKDIIDFFARARLGTRGITIINQGSSDLFVRATPEERRMMIEEVLGLKEYQLKKAESERKLKATAINLEKIKLMVEEVAPRLRMLKRQVSKYEAREEKQNDLREIENNFFGFKIFEVTKDSDKNKSQIKDFEEKILHKASELKALEENLKQVESTEHQNKQAEELKSRKINLLNKKSQMQKDLGRIEAQLEFLSIRASDNEDTFKKDDLIYLLKDVKNSLEKSLEHKELSVVLDSIKSLAQRIEKFFEKPAAQRTQEHENLEHLKNNLAREFETLENEIKAIEADEAELTKNLEGFNERFRKAFELKESKKEEIRNLESQKKYLVFEIEKSDLKLEDLKNEWIKNERSHEEFNALSRNPKFHPPAGGPNFLPDDAERRIFRLRAELLSIGEIDESLIKETREVETHYNHLTTQSIDLEKASEDLKNLIVELKNEISERFNKAFKEIDGEFNKFFTLMFGGGSAKLKIKTTDYKLQAANSEENSESVSIEPYTDQEEREEKVGIEIELNLPKKRVHSLDVLSGGEKSLVSIAALFALISVSPPPFLVLDEIDAPLDEKNSARFANLIKDFAHKVQFVVVTHNRTVMEAADVLYGVTMNDDGTSKLLSLKLEEAPAK